MVEAVLVARQETRMAAKGLFVFMWGDSASERIWPEQCHIDLSRLFRVTQVHHTWPFVSAQVALPEGSRYSHVWINVAKHGYDWVSIEPFAEPGHVANTAAPAP